MTSHSPRVHSASAPRPRKPFFVALSLEDYDRFSGDSFVHGRIHQDAEEEELDSRASTKAVALESFSLRACCLEDDATGC